MPDLGVYGVPGIGTAKTASWRRVLRSGEFGYLGQGKLLNKDHVRDPGNTGFETHLRAGLMIGKRTSDSKYGASVLGLSTAALTSAGTTLATSAAIATEIVRRFGTTGSFKLTGPPTAGGTVRSLTVTYSAANTSNGNVTITALGVNEVQTVVMTGATAGRFTLRFVNSSGVVRKTETIAFNATIATIQTACDNALGTNAVVVGGTDATNFTLTFSGTGYAALPQTMAEVDITTDMTALATLSVTRTTTGVDGRFVSGSLVQPADGSETILTFMPDGFPTQVSDIDGTVVDTELPKMPIAGEVDGPQLLNWPSDTALQTYVMNALSNSPNGKFSFANAY